MGAIIRDGQYAELSNGTRLHYASAGEPGRPLILFLHGFPEFWYAWHEQLAEFGRDYYAVAPDLRGFNLSSMPADVAAYKTRHIVEDMRLFTGQLGYDKLDLVGHDWGGAVAWNFAIALPGLLKRLMMVNSPHPYLFMRALAHDPAQRKSSEYMNWLRSEGSEAALAKDGFALMDGFFNGMGQPQAKWYTPELREKYHACWARGLTGGVNYYRASPLHPPTEDHPGPLKLDLKPEDFRVTVPTLVIWGENDMALPKTLVDGMEDVVPDLRLVRVPDGTHWVIHEQPALVNRLLREFLA
ncbi:MAG TPA: alpha/beta hydrolase [Burkholderiaceae bacterium]